MVLAEMPDARLCFVGLGGLLTDDGGRTWTLEEYIADRLPGAVASGSVEFLGFQPSHAHALLPLRKKALLTVIPSRYDNFPLTVLEAMSVGCPIVGSRVGGIPELIEDGVSGLLHQPGDAGDLADKILTFLRNPDAAAAAGFQAGLAARERYSAQRVEETMLDFYRRAISAHRARRGGDASRQAMQTSAGASSH